ncbi:MAG: hypothetical protein QM528_06605 [Phycisphaerales bacterium]|nr:hypothetical protein [Phycisphaerales bacterium]
MQKSSLVFFCSIVFLCLSLGCAKKQPFQPITYQSISNVNIKINGLTQADLTFDIALFNPNTISFNLTNVHCAVFLNEKPIGDFILDTIIMIPKNAPFVVSCHYQMNLNNVMSDLPMILSSKEIQLHCKGTVTVKKSVFVRVIPVDYQWTQNIAKFF